MKKKKIILMIVLVSLGIFGLISVRRGDQAEVKLEEIKVINETKPTPTKSFPSQNTENVTIVAGEKRMSLSVPANTLFYDALMEAKDAGKISFLGKNYPGLGFFVTDIGTLHSGDGKHLLYYINKKEATVGVSSYVLKDGDILEWKLE